MTSRSINALRALVDLTVNVTVTVAPRTTVALLVWPLDVQPLEVAEAAETASGRAAITVTGINRQASSRITRDATPKRDGVTGRFCDIMGTFRVQT